MTDQDVRDFLERMAAEEPTQFLDAEPLTRRARRRAARTAIVGAIGVAAAIAVLFSGAVQLRGASPNVPATDPMPTPRPSPAPGFSTFSSPLHGITIDYPAGWKVRPAAEPWTLGSITIDASNVDVIFDPSLGDDVYLALVSEPLGGLSGPDWVGGPLFSSAGICADATGANGGSFTLDGASGSIGSCGSPSAGGYHLMVATDTRGYLIYLHVADERALQKVYDWDFFENVLETVDLRPEDAPSTSPRPSPSRGSTRFTSTIQGISIDHPSDWQVRPATERWNKDAFTFDAPGVDVIFDPAHQDDLYLSLASLPLAGQSAEDWCCSKLRASLWASAQVCEAGGNFGRISVNGAEATIRGCDGFGNAFEDHVVQVATATHGYVIYLHVGDDPILQATYTEAWFDAALETVDLR